MKFRKNWPSRSREKAVTERTEVGQTDRGRTTMNIHIPLKVKGINKEGTEKFNCIDTANIFVAAHPLQRKIDFENFSEDDFKYHTHDCSGHCDLCQIHVKLLHSNSQTNS